MAQNSSAQALDFNEKRLHWASVVRGSFYGQTFNRFALLKIVCSLPECPNVGQTALVSSSVVTTFIYYKKRKENNGQKTKPFVECQQSNRHWLPNRFGFFTK